MRNESSLRSLGWVLHLAGAITLLLGYSGLRAFVLSPIERSTRRQTEEVNDYRERLRTAPDTRNEHAELHKSLQKLEELARHVQSRIPREPRESDFLEQISAAAQNRGIPISNYRRGATPVVRDTHLELEVSFQTVGRYDQLCRFLDDLYTLQRIVTVDQCNISSSAANESYTMQLTILLHYGVRPAPIGIGGPNA